jgi:hypothetical protein
LRWFRRREPRRGVVELRPGGLKVAQHGWLAKREEKEEVKDIVRRAARQAWLFNVGGQAKGALAFTPMGFPATPRNATARHVAAPAWGTPEVGDAVIIADCSSPDTDRGGPHAARPQNGCSTRP